MPQQRLNTPDIKKLKSAKEHIDEVIDAGDFENLSESALVTATEAIQWIIDFVENRRNYHKLRNSKQKIELELLRTRLAAEDANVEEIETAAANEAANALLNQED